MEAFEAAEDMAARAREQTSRSCWTSSDYSDLGVSWALEEERAEQAAEAAEYARRVGAAGGVAPRCAPTATRCAPLASLRYPPHSATV